MNDSATRLRWGGSYVNMLLQVTPDDSAAIEQAIGKVLAEANAPDVQLTGNNRAALERMSKRVVQWNKDGRHDRMLMRLNGALKDKCAAGSPADRAWCDSLFVPARRA